MKTNNGNSRGKEEVYILDENSPFQVQEAYKNLRTNVRFSLPDNTCHCIGVTSADRGEGKSTTIINLAITFAQIGKKVILIDGDMRLPSVAKKLKIHSVPGLSNYLIGENNFKDVCTFDKKTGLYVIPAGNIPPDATWLLESERMAGLIDSLRKQADYIFIDLPPVTVVTDATILTKQIDGYLLVVASDTALNSKVVEMISKMKLVDAKIIGFVNTHDNKTNSKKYYKKGYYYYK